MKRPAAQEKTLDAHRALARDLSGPDPALDLHRRLPGRDRGRFRDAARLARRGRSSIASAASNTSRSTARPPTSSPRRCREEVKEERWHRFMQHQQAISARRLKRKVGTRQQVIIDEVGPTRRQGPHQGRRAGDRRRGLCREPPAAARRRNRHREDRARRRVRSARHGGGVLAAALVLHTARSCFSRVPARERCRGCGGARSSVSSCANRGGSRPISASGSSDHLAIAAVSFASSSGAMVKLGVR